MADIFWNIVTKFHGFKNKLSHIDVLVDQNRKNEVSVIEQYQLRDRKVIKILLDYFHFFCTHFVEVNTKWGETLVSLLGTVYGLLTDKYSLQTVSCHAF